MRKSIFLLLPLYIAAFSFARDKPQTWLQVQSPHFVVISNGSEKQARHAADQFERMRMVFHAQFPQMHVDPAAPIVVIATKDEKDFRTLEPQEYLGKGKLQLAGLFLRAPNKNYILLRLDAEGDHPYAIVYHEYTHLITSKAEEWLPLWLNEGWAEFYQTTELRDKEALLGQTSPENIMLLRQSRMLPLPVLFAVDRTSPYYHEENKGSIFYAESWALTHYLTVKDVTEHSHLLMDYVVLLSKGTDPVTAATRAFGDLQKLQQALENYVSQSRYTYFKMKAETQVDESAFKVETIPAFQADAIRADFLGYNRRAADARALLDEVLKEDPNNASAHETMGFLAFQEHHLDEASKWYGEAVKLDSKSFLAHYYFAAIAMNSGSLSDEDETRVEASFRTSISLNPEFAPSYDRLAVFYALHHRNLDEALKLATQASGLDPGNLGYRINEANVLMEMGRSKQAITLLRNVGSLAKNPAEQARLQMSLQNIEQYEAAQQQLEEYKQRVSQEQNTNQKISAGEAPEASTPPKLVRRTEVNATPSNTGEPVSPSPEREVHGAQRFLTGTIKHVQCSGLSAMDFVVAAAGHETEMHSDNYYKIEFSALGFTPAGDMQPCTQIEGRPAKVGFIEPSDKSIKDRVVSVELHK
jgi:tetratricopeptide (TPR) repeat protein